MGTYITKLSNHKSPTSLLPFHRLPVRAAMFFGCRAVAQTVTAQQPAGVTSQGTGQRLQRVT